VDVMETRTDNPQSTVSPKPRTWRIVITTMLVSLALVVAGFGGGWLLWGGQPAASGTTAGTATAEPQSDETVVAIAKELLPTVVQLQTTSGLGSGVIYDQSGLILTAAHVVGNSQQLTVRLASGDQVTGQVVGADPNSDVAVVKINHSGLTAAPLAVNSHLEVGQTVVALGSPYGLDQTVTAGVISATDRAVQASDGAVRMVLQTDASINPGNSGGPLADVQGQVVGINDSIFTQSGGSVGVGFALPITEVKDVADKIVAGQPIEVAFLGVSGTSPSQGTLGALITGVVPGSPAADAGIQVGDLITTVDGNRVESMVDLAAEIRVHAPGDTVTLQVTRGGQQTSLDVTLGTMTSNGSG
jgi:putative serine protease PepD